MSVWSALFLMLVPPPPVPPPITQNVADCENPTYASDQLVCSDGALLALDKQLASLLPIPNLPAEVKIEGQEDWFRRSRMCAMRADHRVCLSAAYRERISVALATRVFAKDPAQWVITPCGKRIVQVADIGHGILAVKQNDRIWLALTATELASWTPYSWAQQKGSRLEIHGPDNVVLRCKPVGK